MNIEETLSPGEVAKIFGVHINWIYKHKSKIGFIKPNRKIRFLKSDVQAFISKHFYKEGIDSSNWGRA